MQLLNSMEVEQVSGGWGAIGAALLVEAVKYVATETINAISNCSGYADPSNIYSETGYVG
jgi:hypothetical protein